MATGHREATLTLALAKAFGGPLAVAYPVLVVGSGLWFRVRYVVLTTSLSMIAYVAPMIAPAVGPGGLQNPHWHVVVVAAVAVLGSWSAARSSESAP